MIRVVKFIIEIKYAEIILVLTVEIGKFWG